MKHLAGIMFGHSPKHSKPGTVSASFQDIGRLYSPKPGEWSRKGEPLLTMLVEAVPLIKE
jgi:hypothetical protein